MRDERANKLKVQYLYGTHGSRCSGHKREGGCALPGGGLFICSVSYPCREARGWMGRSQPRA